MMLTKVKSWIDGCGCPFYRLICSRRKKKCVGYFEGFTDAQAMAAGRMILDFLKDYEVTEEGQKAFDAIHKWADEQVEGE